MAGYSGTPLAKKLGIKEAARVVLLGPPPGFAPSLEPLPAGTKVAKSLPAKGEVDVVLLFVTKKTELERGLAAAKKKIAENGGIWISWPKKASGVATEVDESVARRHGLATGLVDNKVCAIDDTWSGLRFVVRVADRKKSR